MRNYSLILSFAIAATACDSGKEEPPAPVPTPDMQYIVSVEVEDTTCNDEPAPPASAVLDIMLRGDGDVSISHRSPHIPGPRVYEKVTVVNGLVRHEQSVESGSGFVLPQKISGNISPDGVDLTIKSNGEVYADGSYGRGCLRTVRLKGKARDLASPGTYDGHYRAEFISYGYACGDADRSEETRLAMPVDIAPLDGRLVVTLDRQLQFSLTPPDGDFSWEGSLMLVKGARDFPIRLSKAFGSIRPGAIDFVVEYPEPGQDPSCLYRYVFRGPKNVPSADVEGDYAAHYEYDDQCEGLKGAIDQATSVMRLDDRRLMIIEGDYHVPVELMPDGSYSTTIGSEEEGATLVYEVSSDPPHLKYRVTYRSFGTGGECSAVYDVTAEKRFIR